jgi:hypothetical protein
MLSVGEVKMKRRFHHPLWTHLPAAAVLIYFIVRLASVGSLPAEAPVHYTWNGVPNGYGSPWLAFGLTVGLSLFFIALSVFLDELWARQEKAKTFNWLSLLDDIVVGSLVGIGLGYLEILGEGTALMSFAWNYLLVFGGGAVALAVILEKIRPYRPDTGQPAAGGDNCQDTITLPLRDNQPFVYWDYQNPFYISVITVGLPLIFLISAVFTWFSVPWASLLIGVVGILLIIPYGGQRTMVTRDDVTIRWGIFGLKVLRLKTVDITGAQTQDFAPLKDFGGYGIRYNGKVTAYYFRGSRGVKVTTNSGKQYLIGSDRAGDLLAVIKAVMNIRQDVRT